MNNITIVDLINDLEKQNIQYEFINDNELKIQEFVIVDKNGRFYIMKNDKEKYSSDNFKDVYKHISALLNIIENRFYDANIFCHIFDVETESGGGDKSVAYDKQNDNYYMIQTIFCGYPQTTAYDITSSKLAELIDMSQKNGFISEAQRKYLEEHIKIKDSDLIENKKWNEKYRILNNKK